MTLEALRRLRLLNQHLLRSSCRTPEDVVSRFGAVQAQDYAAAKWALGLRATRVTDAVIEQAFGEGRILRTHVLRPTWHFVAPADIRWMLALTAPRVHAIASTYHARFGLDRRVLARSRAALARALEGGRHLTRGELIGILRRARLPVDGPAPSFLVLDAELEGLVCSGPRRGRQFTWALLEERVPRVTALDRDEALAELTRRYFASHGPATIRDFAWWSGLTQRDARIGLDANNGRLEDVTVDGRTYWHTAGAAVASTTKSTSLLLPNYDEYLVAYRDRELVADPPHVPVATARTTLGNSLVIDGRLAGSWTRTMSKGAVTVGLAPARRFSRRETLALNAAVERYAAFANA